MNEERSVPTNQPGALPLDGQTKTAAIAGAIIPARRRFLAQGLAGGSVALLASTHRALAGGSTCLHSYSGYQSVAGGAVGSAGGACYSGGVSPGYYKNHTSWPSPYVATGANATTFAAVFGSLYVPSGFTSSTTLLDILKSGGGGTTAAARQFIAAFLNAAGGGGVTNYPYTTTRIVSLWQQYFLNPTQLTNFQNYFSTYLDV